LTKGKRLTDSASTMLYLDTNVYSRPFDEQTQTEIQEEANAFLEIIGEVKKGAKIKDFLELCDIHLESSEDVLELAKRIQSACHIRARDALHIASAIIGQAGYFLPCDKKVTEMKQARCYRRLAKPYRSEYFSAMNPILFAERLKKGKIK
jgi:hypothetical protein